MKVIVGLGNPGEKYGDTRHNLGFVVVDKLGDRVKGIGASWEDEKKFKAQILKFNYTLYPNPLTLILVKPQTYMNNSGLAVGKIVEYFKVSPGDLIVIHDDLDIPLGKIKIRIGGSAGGHHGVESIIKALGDDQFIRVRLGIGNTQSLRSEHDKKHVDVEHFVLEPFISSEKTKVKQMIKHVVDALDLVINKGIKEAQNQYN